MCVHNVKDARGGQVRGVHRALSFFPDTWLSLLSFCVSGFSFSMFSPLFWLLYWWMYSKCFLTFLFLPFFFYGTRKKVLRLLRSWIKHMNMTKSLVTSVSLQWVLASWSQTRHVLFMSQRILSDSLHFHWLLILEVSEQEWLAKEAGHKGWIANSAACEDNDICVISEACSCDPGVWALSGGSDGVR